MNGYFGCGIEREIWGTMGRLVRDKKSIRQKDVQANKCGKLEGSALNVEWHGSQKIFHLINDCKGKGGVVLFFFGLGFSQLGLPG